MSQNEAKEVEKAWNEFKTAMSKPSRKDARRLFLVYSAKSASLAGMANRTGAISLLDIAQILNKASKKNIITTEEREKITRIALKVFNPLGVLGAIVLNESETVAMIEIFPRLGLGSYVFKEGGQEK